MVKKDLREWQELLDKAEQEMGEAVQHMDEREDVYRGRHTFREFIDEDVAIKGKEVKYVYNAAAETIEAQVSSDIPMPKVTARRPQDEHLAVIIENMLRNEVNRMPFEQINDIAERTVPVQGGGLYAVAWDNRQRSHTTIGELDVSFMHPKWMVPQPGVYTAMEDMEYFFLKIPQTVETIYARYGVDVSEETESDPQLKGTGGEDGDEGMVTQIVAYYRNEAGGIGMFSWVNEVELADMEDCQARRLKRCVGCGAVEPAEGAELGDGGEEPGQWHKGDPCPVCGGSNWAESEEDYETVPWEQLQSITRSDGSLIWDESELQEMMRDQEEPAEEHMPEEWEPEDEPAIPVWGDEPKGLRIPYYKPNAFPVVLQKNVSVFGQLLGESDIDKITSLQDAMNRMNKKIMDRFLGAGSVITLPPDPSIKVESKELRALRLKNVTDRNYIGVYDFSGDLSQEMVQVNNIYQQMRQIIGVTDSFQGRVDRTATSGKAKEFSAAQAAGRMESKRVMKEAAYADLYRLMFQFRLAYADEPRPVVYQDGHGKTVYDQFNRWDFLERDEAGNLYWNDQFLFACDSASPLAQNRERMWQETTSFLQAGAYGDPTKTETLVEYWRKMELLHYPGAGETRQNLQERLEREQQMAGAAAAAPAMSMGVDLDEGQIEELARERARQDAISSAAARRAALDAGMSV